MSAKSQNEDNIPFENHTANGQEEEESQTLICTTLTSTLSMDEAELSDNESDECTENVVNSPNDKQSTTPTNAVQNSADADSNIQWESEHPAIKKIGEIGMSVNLRCHELNLLSQYENQGQVPRHLSQCSDTSIGSSSKSFKTVEVGERFLGKHGFAPTYENYETEEIT